MISSPTLYGGIDDCNGNTTVGNTLGPFLNSLE
jgi:hypothetical protein